MKTIKSPFGTMDDEQAMIDQFYELHGRDTAEALDRLMKQSFPLMKLTKVQVFRHKAVGHGFTDEQINDFLQLT